MKKWFLIAFLYCSGSAFACSMLPATTAFIVFNDKNGDQMLNQQEWINAQADKLFKVRFKINDTDEFLRLDYDKNSLIEAREIGFENVVYTENPCNRYSPKRVLSRKNKSHHHRPPIQDTTLVRP